MRTHTRKIAKSLFAITALTGAVVFLASYDQPGRKRKFYAPTENPKEWEQAPPIAEAVDVTQLSKPLSTGENMLIEVRYGKEASVTSNITMNLSDEVKVVLHDDGLNGDVKAGDLVYSSFVNEDIPAFQAEMTDFNEQLVKKRGELAVFTGRTVTTVTRDQPFFDVNGFAGGKKVSVPADIFRMAPDRDANPGQLKSTLLQTRNYDGTATTTGGVGTATGRNFGGPPPPPPPPIVKHKSLFITDQSVVSDPVRTFNPCTRVGNFAGAWTFGTMVKGMAFQTLTGISARTFVRHWLRRWMVDTTINFELVRNRSTQMLNQVIRPWIRKARNNFVLSVTTANWQTEWDATHQDSLLKYAPFALTAIVNRIDLRGNSGYGGLNNTGETRFIFTLIRNTNTANCAESVANGGFDGFNVIFEYGNSQRTCSSLQTYGNQWANLSTLPFGAGFNAALEAITHQVTDSNRVASKPNRSALNQIRTNEIAVTNSAGTVATSDASPRWQFRQFKIQSTNNRLEETPIDLEPNTIYNRVDGASAANQALMAAWVNTAANSNAIKANNYTIPASLPGGQPFLAAKINYQSVSPFIAPHFFDGSAAAGPGFITQDSVREILSLNTCSGCHSLETQTTFAHVRYADKGTPMTYWNNVNPVGENDAAGRLAPFISGFLTGFEGTVPPPGPFITPLDDSVSAVEDATDAGQNGDFWVNDPAGRRYPGTLITRKWGFNDLKRRSQDLTNFLTNACPTRFSTIALARIAFFRPLNMAH